MEGRKNEEVLQATPSPLSWFLQWQRLLIVAILIAIYWKSAADSELSVATLIEGIPNIFDIMRRMLPPNLSILASLIKPTLQTVEMAILGTTLAMLLSMPLGILAAKNLTPNPLLYNASRFILNALRAISEIVFALVFVAAVGLGPFPGVLALAVHSAGQLGKFYAEAIENIDPGPVEALEATGAHKLQVIAYAIIPQVIPEFVTYTLYRWEVNVRAAAVLGLVGAGGVGFELMTSMRLFQYRNTSTILLVILATVTLVDHMSSKIRSAII